MSELVPGENLFFDRDVDDKQDLMKVLVYTDSNANLAQMRAYFNNFLGDPVTTDELDFVGLRWFCSLYEEKENGLRVLVVRVDPKSVAGLKMLVALSRFPLPEDWKESS